MKLFIDEQIRILRKAMRKAELLEANLILEINKDEFETLKEYCAHFSPDFWNEKKIRFMGIDIKEKK